MVDNIRVLIVDNNSPMLGDLRDELADEFEIAGTAQNSEESLRAVDRLHPDVLVLDITMPIYERAAGRRTHADSVSYDSRRTGVYIGGVWRGCPRTRQ